MNRSVQSAMLGAGAIVLALLLPGMLTFNLVRAAASPATQLESGLLQAPMILAQADTGGARSSSVGAGMVTGVLYTRGRAEVAWNGARFSLDGGSYAYVGGETVRMAAGSMGLLKLPGGGSVYLCAGSSARLSRGPGGGYILDVMVGSTRVQMPAGTDFTIRANDTVVRPTVTAFPEAGLVEVEVQERPDGGCLICELNYGIVVSAGGQEGASAARPGRIMEVSAPRATNGPRISVQEIPPALIQAVSSEGEGVPAYLCRCEDLKKDLDSRPEENTRLAASETGTDSEAASSVTATTPADSAPAPAETSPTGTAVAPSQGPSTPPAPVVADGPPPLAPPDVPPAAVADASAPDPFDPNVLPPPAAGEPSDPVVVVAPPGVPSFGSGGGGGTSGVGGGGGGGPVASNS